MDAGSSCMHNNRHVQSSVCKPLAYTYRSVVQLRHSAESACHACNIYTTACCSVMFLIMLRGDVCGCQYCLNVSQGHAVLCCNQRHAGQRGGGWDG